jgi:hypothetical protein
MSDSYRIIDEPAPSPLSRVIVNPFVIVIAGMVLPFLLGSVMRNAQLLALFWFAVNGFALRGVTLGREIAWIVGGAALLLAFIPAMELAITSEVVSLSTWMAIGPYIGILRSAAALTVLYRVYLYQHDSYQLHRYLRGRS